jgi:hypothetical protein
MEAAQMSLSWWLCKQKFNISTQWKITYHEKNNVLICETAWTTLKNITSYANPGVEAHACNPSTWDPSILRIAWLHSDNLSKKTLPKKETKRDTRHTGSHISEFLYMKYPN